MSRTDYHLDNQINPDDFVVPDDDDFVDMLLSELSTQGIEAPSVDMLVEMARSGDFEIVAEVLGRLIAQNMPEWSGELCRAMLTGDQMNGQDYFTVASFMAALVDMGRLEWAVTICSYLILPLPAELAEGAVDGSDVAFILGHLIRTNRPDCAGQIAYGLFESPETASLPPGSEIVPHILSTLLHSEEPIWGLELAKQLMYSGSGEEDVDYNVIAWCLVQLWWAGLAETAAIIVDELSTSAWCDVDYLLTTVATYAEDEMCVQDIQFSCTQVPYSEVASPARGRGAGGRGRYARAVAQPPGVSPETAPLPEGVVHAKVFQPGQNKWVRPTETPSPAPAGQASVVLEVSTPAPSISNGAAESSAPASTPQKSPTTPSTTLRKPLNPTSAEFLPSFGRPTVSPTNPAPSTTSGPDGGAPGKEVHVPLSSTGSTALTSNIQDVARAVANALVDLAVSVSPSAGTDGSTPSTTEPSGVVASGTVQGSSEQSAVKAGVSVPRPAQSSLGINVEPAGSESGTKEASIVSLTAAAALQSKGGGTKLNPLSASFQPRLSQSGVAAGTPVGDRYDVVMKEEEGKKVTVYKRHG